MITSDHMTSTKMLPYSTRLIYLFILAKCQESGGEVCMSDKSLGASLGIHEQTVWKSVKVLRQMGLVSADRGGLGGGGSAPTRYRLEIGQLKEGKDASGQDRPRTANQGG